MLFSAHGAFAHDFFFLEYLMDSLFNNNVETSCPKDFAIDEIRNTAFRSLTLQRSKAAATSTVITFFNCGLGVEDDFEGPRRKYKNQKY